MAIVDDEARTAAPIFADVLPTVRSASLREALPHDWTWINWALSLLTGPAAAAVMALALDRVAGTALCSSAACPDLAANGSLFNLLYYGPAAVAALTLFLAFFTATYRSGIVVWMGGWALLLSDMVALIVVF